MAEFLYSRNPNSAAFYHSKNRIVKETCPECKKEHTGRRAYCDKCSNRAGNLYKGWDLNLSIDENHEKQRRISYLKNNVRNRGASSSHTIEENRKKMAEISSEIDDIKIQQDQTNKLKFEELKAVEQYIKDNGIDSKDISKLIEDHNLDIPDGLLDNIISPQNTYGGLEKFCEAVAMQVSIVASTILLIIGLSIGAVSTLIT